MEFSQLLFFPIQVQLSPAVFFRVFCEDPAPLTGQAVSRFFTVNFSEDPERRNKEMPIITFWRHFLLECEGTQDQISIRLLPARVSALTAAGVWCLAQGHPGRAEALL